MDENSGYPHFSNPPHGFVWKLTAKRLGRLEHVEWWVLGVKSQLIIQANSPAWRTARYSVDSQHSHHMHTDGSCLWIGVVMSMLPVMSQCPMQCGLFISTYFYIHVHLFIWFRLIQICLQKPLWNITGRPQLPAQKPSLSLSWKLFDFFGIWRYRKFNLTSF